MQAPDPTRINRADLAHDRLKRDILANRLTPGTMIPEPDLADQLGMSRTPVREALIRLAAEGLIELIPRRGLRVLPIFPDDMREIYALLEVLEAEVAAELAQAQPVPGGLTALTQATDAMESALERGDLDAWAVADDQFHRALIERSANRRLSAFVLSLYDQVHRARLVTLRLRETPVRSTHDHRLIVDHIQQGRPDQARAVFVAHRQRSAAELLRLLADYRLHQV